LLRAGAVERKSRRARKNRQPLKVCSSDTLAQLRLKVFEALSVHPKNQQLYMRGSQLEGEQSTLAQVGGMWQAVVPIYWQVGRSAT
jgi:ubiquitin carboxyl-terminal hydrolase 48